MAWILVFSEDYGFCTDLAASALSDKHLIYPTPLIEVALSYIEKEKPDLVIADYRTGPENFPKIVDAALKQGAALLVVSDRPGSWHVFMGGAGNILMVSDIPRIIQAVNAALKQREEERKEQNGKDTSSIPKSGLL